MRGEAGPSFCLDELANAEADFDKALKLAPGDAYAQSGRAEVYQRQNKPVPEGDPPGSASTISAAWWSNRAKPRRRRIIHDPFRPFLGLGPLRYPHSRFLLAVMLSSPMFSSPKTGLGYSA